MYIKDSPIDAIFRASMHGWPALVLRDTGFRAILLGFYYATTDIEHKP